MLISIIVPVYNKEEYIRKSLDSILDQKYKNLEIILVDDESTDNSRGICEEYAKIDARIKIFYQKNGGAAKARNTGLRYAKGEYIAFIDADDYIDTNYIQTLVELAKKYNADIVQCNRYNSNSNRPTDELEETVYEGFDKNGLIYSKLYIPTINPVCKIYRRNLFDAVKFTEGMIYEDECIMHKLLYIANKLVHINKYMYCVVLSPGSVMRNGFSLKRLDYIKALEDRKAFYLETRQKEMYATTIYKEVLGIKKYINQMYKEMPDEKDVIRNLKKKHRKTFIEAVLSPSVTFKNKISLIIRDFALFKKRNGIQF